MRWMLGSLAHFRDDERVAPAKMPELERLMLHRLAELDALVRQAYADFDYKRIFAALNAFMTVDLSAFYFDIRKDALYCDPISSPTRHACLTVLDHLFRATVTWLAPMLPFTAEEAWLSRYPSRGRLGASGAVPDSAGGMARRRAGREVAQDPHRAPRRHRRAGDRARAASASARRSKPTRSCYVSDPDLFAALVDVDLAEICITSAATLVQDEGPADAFRLPDVQRRRGRGQARRRHANARAPGRSRRRSAAIPTIPT